MAHYLRTLLIVGLVYSGGCGTRAPANNAGLDGTLDPPGETAELTSPLRSPAGDLVFPGTRDELGWVLPLDVRRPREPRQRPPAPHPADRVQTRANLGPGPFPEERLGPDDGHTQNETSIDALDGTLVAGWNSFTDASLVMGAGRSDDAGESWSFELFDGHTTMSDPVVSAAGAGRWYFAYIASGGAGGSDYEVYVRRSVDDGASWQAPVAVTDNTDFDDKPYMDGVGDEVVAVWADFGFGPAKVRVANSLDGGLTFINNTILANDSVGGNGAVPLIDGAGDYYVFWRDSFQEFLWMSRSQDQGTSWSSDASITAMTPLPSSLPGGFRMVNLPSAASPAPGHLVVVWNDQALGDPDILAVRSIDGGQNWSAPVRVNDDAGTEAQFLPWIVADEQGGLHVTWYDRRGNGADIDVYTAFSDDGGATFGQNTRVTGAAFTPVLPWEGHAADFIGDYNGIAVDGATLYPFYQDSREGNQDVYVARLPSPGVIFADGFESGDTSAWSNAVP